MIDWLLEKSINADRFLGSCEDLTPQRQLDVSCTHYAVRTDRQENSKYKMQ